MKKLSIMGLALVGTLAVVGIASASPADTLQPATTITYDEEVIVNDTIRVDSAYVGNQDEGGVTFFNGTIVNSTTGDDDANNPVTFGDDVRIDGEIYRTEKGGDNHLKMSDTVMPTTNNTYSLGTSSNRFKDGYLAGSLTTDSLTTAGAITAGNITTSGSLTAGSIVTAGTVDGVDVSTIPSTYVSQSSPSWDSRTGYTSIAPGNCLPEDSNATYFFPVGSSGSYLYTNTAETSFYCSMQLPHGATVTSAKAYVKNDGGEYMTATLYRSALVANTVFNLGTSSTLVGSGVDRTIDINSINETIDNSSNSYYLEVYFDSSGVNYNFKGAIINYTYTQPY